MGVAINSMTHSPKLAELVERCESFENETWDGQDILRDACDMTSTAGYDNDGSTGPELIDNGVQLALAARDYDPKAVIFFAYGDANRSWQTCYYVFGKDESDAIRRLSAELGDEFLQALENEPRFPGVWSEGDENEDCC